MRSPRCRRHSPTLYRHQVSHLISSDTSQTQEGQLYTDRAPDGQRSFHTTLQMVTKQGCKSVLVKVDPGADVYTIPLSHFKTLFPHHFNKDGHLKQNTLRSTAYSWYPHDGHTQYFLQYFTTDDQYKTTPLMSYQYHFTSLKTPLDASCCYLILLTANWVSWNLKYQMRQVHTQWSTPSQIIQR